MRRILTTLLLAVALLPAPMPTKPADVRAGSLLVDARPIPLDASDPTRSSLGPLRFEGGWALSSRNPGFGGISSLLATPEGRLLALSDSGILMGFRVDAPDDYRSFIAPLPIAPADREREWWWWDSESMAHDPATGRYWVGFELQQRICRYAPGFARVEACKVWPDIAAWPKTGSIESMARLPDGRFLVLSEMGMTSDGHHDALLFAGDPVEPDTPAPVHLRYAPPTGFRPTDAVALDDRHILVVNRRLTLQQLFTATIALVELPARPVPDSIIRGRTIATLAPPIASDNYEAIAVMPQGDRTIVWLASDDNHEFFQQTLLLKFSLPRPFALP